MEQKQSKPIRRRRRHLSFDPNSQYIANAVEEYLKGGGKITHLEAQTENSNRDSWLKLDDTQEADEFLKEM
jgi:hypothetical protein